MRVRETALNGQVFRRADVTAALLSDAVRENGVVSTSAERMRRLRERQAARLEAVPDAPRRDDDELLLPAVEQSLKALELGERDAGIAQVARRLASVIDDAQDPAAALRVFGPQLHKVLGALGGTPMARKGMPGKPQRQAPTRLAQLRAAHQNSPAKRRRAGA